MEFKRSTQKVNIYGQDFELKSPTVKMTQKMAQMAEDLEKSDDGDSFDALISYFEALGLPKKVALEMEIDHFLQLIEKFFFG